MQLVIRGVSAFSIEAKQPLYLRVPGRFFPRWAPPRCRKRPAAERFHGHSPRPARPAGTRVYQHTGAPAGGAGGFFRGRVCRPERAVESSVGIGTTATRGDTGAVRCREVALARGEAG